MAKIPLVFLHGFCEDHHIWHPFTDVFTDHYQVITLDLPVEDTVEGMAEHVHDYLSGLDLPPFILIGHSMGGYVSLAYAEKYGEQLKGICLFHSHPFADDADKKEHRTKSMEFVARQGAAAYVRQVIPNLFAPGYANTHKEEVEQALNWADAFYPPERLQAYLKAMRDRPDRSAVLRNIGVPVLFIIGGKDGAVPHKYSMEQTHLPAESHIHLLPEVGHMGFYEATSETQQIIQDFINHLA